MTFRDPSLDPDGKDLLASILKGVVGNVPVVGPLLSETVGMSLPGQRIDRVADAVHRLREEQRQHHRATGKTLADILHEHVYPDLPYAERYDLRVYRHLCDAVLRYRFDYLRPFVEPGVRHVEGSTSVLVTTCLGLGLIFMHNTNLDDEGTGISGMEVRIFCKAGMFTRMELERADGYAVVHREKYLLAPPVASEPLWHDAARDSDEPLRTTVHVVRNCLSILGGFAEELIQRIQKASR
jgi:hypothetical protein